MSDLEIATWEGIIIGLVLGATIIIVLWLFFSQGDVRSQLVGRDAGRWTIDEKTGKRTFQCYSQDGTWKDMP